MHYKTYHWVHVPTGRVGEEGFKDLPSSPSAPTFVFIPNLGVPELEALRVVNLWNRGGSQHDYRYWLEP